MKRALVLMAVVLLTAIPVWSTVFTFDGNVDPTTVGWYAWEGQLQGSVFTETDGTVSWFLDDSSALKTKMTLGVPGTPSETNRNLRVGATVESRMKCIALSEATPLNLGLQLYDGSASVGHWVTAAPDKLLWNQNDTAVAVKSYPVDFTSYHVVRLCYKQMSFNQRSQYTNTWAAYLDGSATPILVSRNNPTGKTWSGPTWGSGNTSGTQKIYFDWVKYDNGGAYPPGMDGTVQFVSGDPDGVPTPGASSLTVSWETNVPTTGEVHYSTDSSYSTVVSDSDPSLKTTHSVTITGITPGATVNYYAVSTDASSKKAISLPAEIVMPNPFFISAGPTVVLAPDCLSATVTWQTSEAATTSEVHYGLDATCSTIVAETATGVTSHSVTVPTVAGKAYYFFVKSNHATYAPVQSAVANFYTYLSGDAVLDNANFDDGAWLNPWVKYGNVDGSVREWWFVTWAHTAPRMLGAAASWGIKNGGAYQTLHVTPDTWYKAQCYIFTYTRNQVHPGDPAELWVPDPPSVHCRIGIDPNGGTDPNSTGIQWCTSRYTERWDTGEQTGWQPISTVAKAGPDGNITIFLNMWHDWALAWNVTAIDTVSIADESTAGPIDYSDHIGKAKKILKEGYPVNFSNKVVTAVWIVQAPEQNPQVRTYCYISELDGSGGIKVDYSTIGVAVNVGNKISVSGNLDTVGGETQITATALTNPSPDVFESLPKPVAMTAKQVASGSLGVQPALPNSAGLSSAGLRVRVVGKVTGVAMDPGGSGAYIAYVDDGTTVANDSAVLLSGTTVPGIKVFYSAQSGPYLLDDGVRLAITGVAGVDYHSTVGPFPIVHVNNGDPGMDINIFSAQ